MSHTVKMLIPISLGVIAALINFALMSSSVKPVSFVQVSTDVPVDAEFTPDMLAILKAPNEFKSLKGKAVPWEERGVLIGQKPSRHLFQGDVVLFQDISMKGPSLDLRDGETAMLVSITDLSVPPGHMRIGGMVEFRLPSRYSEPDNPNEKPVLEDSIWVGPFRIMSIDGRTSNVVEYRNMGTRYVSEITILYPSEKGMDAELKANLEKLMEFTDRQRTGNDARMAGIRFLGDERN